MPAINTTVSGTTTGLVNPNGGFSIQPKPNVSLPAGFTGSAVNPGAAGPTSMQLGQGFTSGLSNFLGPLDPSTTAAFASGASAQPANVPSGLNLGKGTTSIGTAGIAPTPAPAAPTGGGSIGSYKGVPITAGTQAQIQAQMAAIDAKQSGGAGVGAGAGGTGGAGGAGGVSFGGKTYTPGMSAPAGYVWNAQGTGFVPASTTITSAANQQSAGASSPPSPYTAATPAFGSTVGAEAQTAATSSPQYQAAQKAYMDAAQQLQQLQAQGAQQFANIGGSRTNLAEAGGEAGLVQNLLAGQESALTGEMQAAQASAAAATGQQATQQAGLGQAAGLISPQLGQYGQTFYYPGQGAAGGGAAGVSPSDPFYSSMQTYAQDMVSGQMSGIPSSVTSNPALMAQLQDMAKQIDPNFNINKSTAMGGTQQSQTQQQQQYQSAAQQAKNLGTQLNQLITQGGINPSNINAVNSFIQNIATNTSNPNYQTFQNLVNDMANTYAQVLTPAGGSTTDMVRNLSQSLLNAAQSGQSILQVMNNLDAQVQAKISGVTTAYGGSGMTLAPYTTTNGTQSNSAANPWH